MGARRYLAIETSGRIGLVGLGIDGQTVAERRCDDTRRHARDLMPICRDLLTESKWKPADLSAIVVSLGPGSYTGLRVGVMAAKAMAYALRCQLIGVPTFDAIARQADVQQPKLDVIGDALNDKMYVRRYARDSQDEPWTPQSDLHIAPISEWAAGLTEQVAVTGPGLAAVSSRIPSGISVAPMAQRIAQLPALLALGHESSAAADPSAMLSLEPIYLRPSSAEEQWAKLPTRP